MSGVSKRFGATVALAGIRCASEVGGIQERPCASAVIARTVTGIDFAAGVPLFAS